MSPFTFLPPPQYSHKIRKFSHQAVFEAHHDRYRTTLAADQELSRCRDWQQFHNSKDLAVALSIETSELQQPFPWKGNEEAHPEKLKEELADVLMYALLLADKHGLDIKQIIDDKIKRNNEKYPVEKAKGTAKKYNEL
ncbi:nucleotide pyrophosphohydrolase [Sphingobacterium haloxyli]|uniref:Nucleotide pyrophosphohydrolase n=1 Tax=Sphingobacterium haloxyli TaxID=2100533 RepID=A0A2S9J050_9SPHI|nr:nucleotide pyrophosphohydrolase [Sphingobacterium haloxyli]PRD46159.1 nucleotide pyrophosphohydrolase [Sphingobacterium haloxyli]